MNKEELLKLSPGELTDLGICPTCFNRENGGALYGDNSDKMLYEDEDIECFFVGNPRAAGHMCISTMEHYHDMSEAPDHINEKIIRFAKRFMQILCEVYGCERVYLCTMCDGLNNVINSFVAESILNGVTDESWNNYLAQLQAYNYEYYIEFYNQLLHGEM